MCTGVRGSLWAKLICKSPSNHCSTREPFHHLLKSSGKAQSQREIEVRRVKQLPSKYYFTLKITPAFIKCTSWSISNSLLYIHWLLTSPSGIIYLSEITQDYMYNIDLIKRLKILKNLAFNLHMIMHWKETKEVKVLSSLSTQKW